MESAPLNKAHEFGRKAVKSRRKGNLAEASEHHRKSASLLEELRAQLPNDSLVLDSLLQQRRDQIQKADLAIFMHFRRDAEAKRKMDGIHGTAPILEFATKQIYTSEEAHIKGRGTPYAHILKRTLDESDSLLQVLLVGKKGKTESTLSEHVPDKPTDFAVRPKCQADVIEELRVVNCNLRGVVDNLLHELEAVRKENTVLKQKLAIYKKNEVFDSDNATLPQSDMTPLECPPEMDL